MTDPMQQLPESMRLTPQRRDVLALLAEHSMMHLTAEQLFLLGRQKGACFSPATLYRTLHLLVERGIIKRLKLADGSVRYDLNQGSTHHHHLICLGCCAIFDVHVPMESAMALIKEAHGFSVKTASLLIYGYCSTCQRELKMVR